MNEFIGREIDFAVAVEGTRGTAESVASKNVRKVTADLTPMVEKVIDDSTFGRLEDSENSRIVRRWSEGNVEGIVHVDVLGYYLTNLYGSKATTEPETDVFQHIFTLEQNIQHPTLTGFIKEAGVRQLKVPNLVFSSFEINATTDNYVRYSGSIMGKESIADTSTIPALDNEYDFIGKDVTVKQATTLVGLGSADAIKAKEISVSWETNAEADYVFGDDSPDNIYNKQFTITGSFTRNFSDTVFANLYQSDEYRYMSITIEGDAVLGDEKPTIELILNKVSITNQSTSAGADDLVTETVEFKAFYNAVDTQQSRVRIINITENY